MDFRNVNRLNTLINMFAANLLPLTAEAQFSPAWRVYYAIIMLIEVVHTVALVCGLILSPLEKALSDGTVCSMITVEVLFMLTRLYTKKDLMVQVVEKMNKILHNADETMKEIVKSTLKQITIPYGIYGAMSATTITIWTITPIGLALERSSFYYVDYNLPTAFTSEPFSAVVLILSSIFMTIGSVYLFLKKFSVDMYMMHLVLLLTAQYRYMGIKLMMIFRNLRSDDDDQDGMMHHPRTDQCARTELREFCRQQNNIMRISFMLKELLSVNFSLLYVTSVFRFCFLGVMLSVIPSLTLVEGISVLFFICGSAYQLFLLCLCVQTLSDASTKVTDKSFGERWYEFGTSVKRTFMILMMASNIEYKIAAFDKFNLSLPSFMTIMNQSYSIALVLMRVN